MVEIAEVKAGGPCELLQPQYELAAISGRVGPNSEWTKPTVLLVAKVWPSLKSRLRIHILRANRNVDRSSHEVRAISKQELLCGFLPGCYGNLPLSAVGQDG